MRKHRLWAILGTVTSIYIMQKAGFQVLFQLNDACRWMTNGQCNLIHLTTGASIIGIVLVVEMLVVYWQASRLQKIVSVPIGSWLHKIPRTKFRIITVVLSLIALFCFPVLWLGMWSLMMNVIIVGLTSALLIQSLKQLITPLGEL
jgi:hypothetical protein